VRLPNPISAYWNHWFSEISPDAKRVRFNDVENRVWESNLDGSGQHQILQGLKETICCGTWAPDGKLFVFSSEGTQRDSLWAVTESGFPFYRVLSSPVQLTDGPVSFRYSAVSKDGRQVFAIGETKQAELSVYDAESGKFRPYLNGISAGFPDFSHDGQWVTYVSHPDGALWRSRMDGSDPLQLTDVSLGRIIGPKWSPDGRFIAFSALDHDLNPKIYLIPADGGDPMLLISGEVRPAEFRPAGSAWSPDGNSIVYGGMGGTGAATEIRILNLVTKETRTLPGSLGLFAPIWSPDGRSIVAQSENSKRLFVYSLETNHWTELPAPHMSSNERIGWPAWSHDSRYLYAMAANKIYRYSVPGGTPELVVAFKNSDILCPVFPWDNWFGLTADDRPLVLRNAGIDELYALDLKYR
jgi:WD40 repeat protein